MRKFYLIFAVCLFSGIASLDAGVKIKSQSQVKVDTEVYHPVLNCDASQVLFSQDDYAGLKIYNFTTKQISEISDNVGAGFNARFSPDGESVYFKNSKVVNRLRNSNLMEFKVALKSTVELLPMSRDRVIMAAHNGKMMIKSGAKNIGGNNNIVMAYDDFNKIVVVKNGAEIALSPIEDAHSYMDASISPDGTKILFSEPYKGIFICNTDGSNLQSFGRGESPKWFGNETIVMTKSKDDGYIILESRLYVVSIDTHAAVALTSDSVKVDDYSVAAEVGKIAYTTHSGELFIIEFEK